MNTDSCCCRSHGDNALDGLSCVLTKPDVSFLVVITTLAGFALGAIGPLDWWRMALIGHGHDAGCCGHCRAESLYRARPRRAHAAHRARARCPTGVLPPWEALVLRRCPCRPLAPSVFLLATNALAAFLGLTTSVTYLGLVYASEDPHDLGYAGRRVPRRHAAADRLGSRPRELGSRSLGAFRDLVPVAGSAFPRHLVDVSRGLRPRRDSHVAGCGSRAATRPSGRSWSAPRR